MGIERCEAFTRARGGNVPMEVVQHCHDKLLRLLPAGFIRTSPCKLLEEPLHREIEEYVRANSANE